MGVPLDSPFPSRAKHVLGRGPNKETMDQKPTFVANQDLIVYPITPTILKAIIQSELYDKKGTIH